MKNDVNIRLASREDTQLIMDLIKEFSEYEHSPERVTATKEDFERFMFDEKYAETLIFSDESGVVGYMIFDYIFATYEGKPVLHIENFFLRESARGKGYGKRGFEYVFKLALEKGCFRADWTCLHWNVNSMAVYDKMGAVRFNEKLMQYRTPLEVMQRVAGNY